MKFKNLKHAFVYFLMTTFLSSTSPVQAGTLQDLWNRFTGNAGSTGGTSVTAPATTDKSTNKSGNSSVSTGTSASSSFCIQKISELPHLMRLYEEKKRAAAELIDSAYPTIRAHRNFTAEEMRQVDPQAIENVLVAAGFDQKLNAYIQKYSLLNTELERVFNSTPLPRCEPSVIKDMMIVTALMLQQTLEATGSVFLSQNVRKLERSFDYKMPIGDQLTFEIIRSSINGQIDMRALHDVALYAASGGSERILWEKGLYEGVNKILRQLDAKGQGSAKPLFMGHVFPILLVTCDAAGVNKGMQAPSCKLINEQSALLKEFARSGKAKEVIALNRIGTKPKLIVFPVGTTDVQNCNTVNFPALIELYTPERLNYGDCPVANVIFNCPRTLGNQQAYINDCSYGALCNPWGRISLLGAGGAPSGGGRQELAGGSTSSAASGVGRVSTGNGPALSDRLAASGPTGFNPADLQSQFCSGNNTLSSAASSAQIPDLGGCSPIHQTAKFCGMESADGTIIPEMGAPTGDDCGVRGRAPAVGGGLSPGMAAAYRLKLTAEFIGRETAKALGKAELAAQKAAVKGAAEKWAAEVAAEEAATKGASTAGGVAGLANTLGSFLFSVGEAVLKALQQNQTPTPGVPPMANNNSGNTGSGSGSSGESGGSGGTGGATASNGSGSSGNNSSGNSTTQSGSGGTPAGEVPSNEGGSAVADSFDPTPASCTALGKELIALKQCIIEEIQPGLEAMGKGKLGAAKLGNVGSGKPSGDGRKALYTGDGPTPVDPQTSPDLCVGGPLAGAPAPSGGGAKKGCEAIVCPNPGNPAVLGQACCGQSPRDIEVGGACPLCDGKPAFGPDKQCLSECPRVETNVPTTGEGGRTPPTRPGAGPGPTNLNGKPGVAPLPLGNPGGGRPVALPAGSRGPSTVVNVQQATPMGPTNLQGSRTTTTATPTQRTTAVPARSGTVVNVQQMAPVGPANLQGSRTSTTPPTQGTTASPTYQANPAPTLNLQQMNPSGNATQQGVRGVVQQGVKR